MSQVRLPLLAQPSEEPVPERRAQRKALACIAVSDAVTGSRAGLLFLRHLISAFPTAPRIATSHARLARELRDEAQVIVVTSYEEVDALGECELSYGVLIPARRTPRVHVMLTSGALVSSWSRAAVSVRGEVDVILSDAREVLARRLVTRLLDERLLDERG